MDFEIECTGVEVEPANAYGVQKVRVKISGAKLAELIDAAGRDDILYEIGAEEAMAYFGIEAKE